MLEIINTCSTIEQYLIDHNSNNNNKIDQINGRLRVYSHRNLDLEKIATTEEECEKDTSLNIGTDLTFDRKYVWFNVFGFLLLHLGALYGLYLCFTEAKLPTTIWSIALMWLTGEGITIGAHRLWTHRSFRATPFLRTILMILQTAAGQNCIWIWARDHRQHHRYADTDADPHNADRGFFFSHIGWLMTRKHPLVIKMGKHVNMDDLNADSIVMFQKKYYKTLYMIFAILIPVIVPVYYWGESWKVSLFCSYLFRYVFLLNGTWTVNSIAHIYGYRPFDKSILAVESTFVSVISSGEGWHNYHHVFPWDYKAAEFGTSLQTTTHIINALARLGLAYDLKQASKDIIKLRSKRTGDEMYNGQEKEKIR